MKIHPYVIVFLSAIVAANLLASYFGPTITIYTAFLFIGLDLFVRDTLHDLWKEKLPQKMFLLVLAGSMITVALNINAGPIALASTLAFAVAFIGDGLSYHFLKERMFLLRSNGSNVVGSLLDSIIFPTVAFGMLMPEIVAGQFLAKVLGGAVWSVLFVKYSKRFA